MIISSQHVESQNDLIIELEKAGISIGQATLSRDLKQLRVSKVRMPNGRSVYAFPRESQYATIPSREELNNTKWGLDFSGNIAVIKTRNGYAAGLAYDIDMHDYKEILGTIPGSDTIFAILREGVTHEDARKVLSQILPL